MVILALGKAFLPSSLRVFIILFNIPIYKNKLIKTGVTNISKTEHTIELTIHTNNILLYLLKFQVYFGRF